MAPAEEAGELVIHASGAEDHDLGRGAVVFKAEEDGDPASCLRVGDYTTLVAPHVFASAERNFGTALIRG